MVQGGRTKDHDLEEELDHNLALSPRRVELLAPFDVLENQLSHVTILPKQLNEDHRDHKNVVIGFLNDL